MGLNRFTDFFVNIFTKSNSVKLFGMLLLRMELELATSGKGMVICLSGLWTRTSRIRKDRTGDAQLEVCV